MTKIMLVEDDKSLREIYGVRLLAEGYDIVSAGDGEEALAMAIKERPTLIVSDVMMPKISGFDMLDILRSTTETKDIKVIMMTALSSEEQRTRGESLGADRYLVKSQVGIEDVVRVVHEVLGDQATVGTSDQAAVVTTEQPAAATPTPAPAQPVATPAPAPAPVTAAPAPQPVAAQPTPAAATPTTPAATPVTPTTAPAPAAVETTSAPAAPTTIPTPMHPQPATPATTPMQPPSTAPKPPSQRARIIQPLNDPTQSSVDLDDLLNKELEKESSNSPEAISVEQESALIDEQLAGFVQTEQPAETAQPAAPVASTATPIAVTAPDSVAAPAPAAPTPAAAVPVDSVPAGSNDDVPGINIGPDGSVTPEAQDATDDTPTASPPTTQATPSAS